MHFGGMGLKEIMGGFVFHTRSLVCCRGFFLGPDSLSLLFRPSVLEDASSEDERRSK